MAQPTPEEFVKRIAAGFGIGWTGEPDFWRGGAEAGAALVRERDAAVRRAALEELAVSVHARHINEERRSGVDPCLIELEFCAYAECEAVAACRSLVAEPPK